MGLKIQRRVTTKARVITTLIAVFALLVQPVYGFVAGQVANALVGTTINVCTAVTVDCTHTTIQSAINDATAGDVVFLLPGTYVGNVLINKDITLKSAHTDSIIQGKVTIKAAGSGATVSNLMVQPNVGDDFAIGVVGANNVEINNNTITSVNTTGTNQSAKGIYVGDSGNDGVKIHQNLITAIRADASKGAYGILFNKKDFTNASVYNNTIQKLNGSWATAIGLEGNTPNALVTGNKIKELTGTPQAVHFEDNASSKSVTLTGNTLDSKVLVKDTSNVAVNSNWSAIHSTPNTYPEVLSQDGVYRYYGINAFSKLQQGLNAVSVDGTVKLADGIYTEGSSNPVDGLTFTQAGTKLIGQSRSGTIIAPINNQYGYGLTSESVNGVSVSNLTIQSAATSGAALKFHNAKDISLSGITIKGLSGNKANGLDLNSVINSTLNDVIVSDFYKNGIAITGQYASSDLVTKDVSMQDVTSNHNGWNGLAFYTVGNDGSTKVIPSVGPANNITGVVFAGSNKFTNNGSVGSLGSGVFIEGDTDANARALHTPRYSVSGVNGAELDLGAAVFSGNYLDINNYQTMNVNAPAVNLNGKVGIAMSATERTAQNSKIIDKLDNGTFGLVNYAGLAKPVLRSPGNGVPVKGQNLMNDWDDVTGASKYIYQSFNVDNNGVCNLNSKRFTGDGTTYVTSQTNTRNVTDPTFCWRVAAVDVLGNQGPWSDMWKTVVDNKAPTATLNFPSIGAKSFTVQYSEAVNEADAKNAANYFLSNWPGAGGSGTLGSDAVVSYDATSHLATVTLTTDGWSVSAEQNWGVRGVEDLAGNPIAETMTSSTPMVKPIVSGLNGSAAQKDITWNWTLTDPASTADGASGIASYAYQLTKDGVVVNDWISQSFSQSPATLTKDISVVTSVSSDGQYILHVYTTDNAGNVSDEVASSAVTVDTLAPVVKITSSAQNSDGSWTFKGSTTDDTAKVYVTISGIVKPYPATLIGTNWSVTTGTDLTAGDHTAIASSTDGSGNGSKVTADNKKDFTVVVATSQLAPYTAPSQPAPARPAPGANLVDPATTLVDPPTVLGTQTAKGSILAASDKVAAIAPSEQGWKIFGTAWYWWVLIVAAVAAIMWWIIAAARRRSENV